MLNVISFLRNFPIFDFWLGVMLSVERTFEPVCVKE